MGNHGDMGTCEHNVDIAAHEVGNVNELHEIENGVGDVAYNVSYWVINCELSLGSSFLFAVKPHCYVEHHHRLIMA